MVSILQRNARSVVLSMALRVLMEKRQLSLPLILLVLATCSKDVTDVSTPNPQSVSVVTQHNDNTRAGLNDHETALTTSNVNVQQFGKEVTLQLDAVSYAHTLAFVH